MVEIYTKTQKHSENRWENWMVESKIRIYPADNENSFHLTKPLHFMLHRHMHNAEVVGCRERERESSVSSAFREHNNLWICIRSSRRFSTVNYYTNNVPIAIQIDYNVGLHVHLPPRKRAPDYSMRNTLNSECVIVCACASYGMSECSQSLSNWRESAKNFRFLLWHQQLMEKFAIEISLNGILNSISKCGLTELIAFVFIWFSLWCWLPRFSTLLTSISQFVYHTDQHWLQFAECSDDCVDRERACGWQRMRDGGRRSRLFNYWGWFSLKLLGNGVAEKVTASAAAAVATPAESCANQLEKFPNNRRNAIRDAIQMISRWQFLCFAGCCRTKSLHSTHKVEKLG